MRIPFISLISAGAIALGGCAYGGLNLGYGDPYSSGYGSQYGYGGGYGGYGYNGGYGGYGYNGGYAGYGYNGYGSPYYGWNDGYYYPGIGYYVYDSYQQPRMWSDTQRRYWTDRQQRAARQGVKAVTSPNWTTFRRPQRTSATTSRISPQQRIEQVRSKADQRRTERTAARTERSATRATRDSETDSTTKRRRN